MDKDIAPLLKRTFDEINENRRRLLQEGYEVFPDSINCDPEKFNWNEVHARANIFDIFYLKLANYVSFESDDAFQQKPAPILYSLTHSGVDLIENPGMLDVSFPVSISAGNVVIGNGNVVANTISVIQEMRNRLEGMPDSPEKKTVLEHLNAFVSHPLTLSLLGIGATIGSKFIKT